MIKYCTAKEVFCKINFNFYKKLLHIELKCHIIFFLVWLILLLINKIPRKYNIPYLIIKCLILLNLKYYKVLFLRDSNSVNITEKKILQLFNCFVIRLNLLLH